MGSLAFAAAARLVWQVSRHPADPDQRTLLMVKSNLPPAVQGSTGLIYRITPEGDMTWSQAGAELDADEVESSEAEPEALSEAVEFLPHAPQGQAAHRGPVQQGGGLPTRGVDVAPAGGVRRVHRGQDGHPPAVEQGHLDPHGGETREVRMAILDEFRRVSRRSPCPVCGRTDWCLIERTTPSPGDEPRVLCQRVESPVRWKDAGWLHGRLRRAERPNRGGVPRFDRRSGRQTVPPPEPAPAGPDLSGLLLRFRRAVDPVALADLSHALGVSEHALRRLEIGRARGAWAFPMRDARGELRGLRLRTDEGSKFAVRGSRQGLFIPLASPPSPPVAGRDRADDEPLFIAEGPTDTAALLDLPGGGVDAVGRPSCNACAGMCAEFVRLHRRWRPVVLLADNDEPGRRGAAALAESLRRAGVRAGVLTPPEGVKDAREWRRRGAGREEVLRAAGARTGSPSGCGLLGGLEATVPGAH
jgi:hypothetical protein